MVWGVLCVDTYNLSQSPTQVVGIVAQNIELQASPLVA
jgi:hypothetical protein